MLNGVYALGGEELFLNGFINVWCVVFGIVIIRTFLLEEGENGR